MTDILIPGFFKGFDTACKRSRLHQARQYHLSKTKRKDPMTLPIKTQQTIKTELGEDALKVILEGTPKLEYFFNFELLFFTVKGKECEYLLDSDPPHFYLGEEDKEFTKFEDLLNEINQSGVIP
jgi:hypothetical protein